MIEIGEFVRTSNNGIKRIDTIFKNKTVNKYGYEIGSEWDGKLYSYIKTTDILKHSKNLIDLIEVGDYVNGYKVIELIRLNCEEISICVFKDREYMHCEILKENNIKTILTHEMYKRNCYEVEG